MKLKGIILIAILFVSTNVTIEEVHVAGDYFLLKSTKLNR